MDEWSDGEIGTEKSAAEEPSLKKCSHVATLVMLFFIMTAVFSVAWEAGRTRSLDMRRERLQGEIVSLEEQHRVCRAAMAEEKMPEAIVRHALDGDMNFVQIPSSSILMVARER